MVVLRRLLRLKSAAYPVLFVLVAVVGAVHVLVRTSSYGAAITSGSTFHLFAAENLLKGEGLQYFTGQAPLPYPPLFSLLLAGIGFLGTEPVEAGRLLNAAAFGLIIGVSGVWLYRNLQSRLLALGASVAVLVSLPLNDLSSYLVTELLFILFTLVALIQLERFLNRRAAKTTWTPLLLASAFAAGAAVTRYAGAALIISGVLMLFMLGRGLRIAARLKHSAVFGAISSIPLLAVLALNWAASGVLTVRRAATEQTLPDSLSQTADVFSRWMVGSNALGRSAYLLWTAAGLLILAAAAVAILSRLNLAAGSESDPGESRNEKPGRSGLPSFGLGPAVPFAVFALVYLVLLVAVAPATTGVIESRYLVALYVPLLLAAALLLDRFWTIEIGQGGRATAARRILICLVLIGALGHISLSALKNLAITARALDSGYIDRTYNTAHNDPSPHPLNASVAKWFDNHTAAISITYDRPLEPVGGSRLDSYVMEQGLVLDYELVTGNTYHGDLVHSGPDDEKLVYLRSELVPKGFGYFGHGHNHIRHDELSYEDALESFQTCYDTMQDWGFKPVAYAYPRNAGKEDETQRALEASGFLSGRLQTDHLSRYYNFSGDQKTPENWFALMALPMQSIEFETDDSPPCNACINDNNELVPVLDEALEHTAWIILTYHAIGLPQYFGWYDWEEFKKDIQSIAGRDFWVSPMNDITLYARERENVSLTIEVFADDIATELIEITISDGLDNTRFNQPLTILFDQPTDWIGKLFTVSQDGEHLDEYVFDTKTVMIPLKPNEQTYRLNLSP